MNNPLNTEKNAKNGFSIKIIGSPQMVDKLNRTTESQIKDYDNINSSMKDVAIKSLDINKNLIDDSDNYSYDQ